MFRSCDLLFYYHIIIGLLLTQATAQNILDAESQDSAKASYSTISVSTQGIIVMCAIIGIVLVIGISFTAILIISKRRGWTIVETICYPARRVFKSKKTTSTAGSTKESKLSDGELSISTLEGVKCQKPKHSTSVRHSQADPEKGLNTVSQITTTIVADGASFDDKRNTRGWGTLFTFGRP